MSIYYKILIGKGTEIYNLLSHGRHVCYLVMFNVNQCVYTHHFGKWIYTKRVSVLHVLTHSSLCFVKPSSLCVYAEQKYSKHTTPFSKTLKMMARYGVNWHSDNDCLLRQMTVWISERLDLDMTMFMIFTICWSLFFLFSLSIHWQMSKDFLSSWEAQKDRTWPY